MKPTTTPLVDAPSPALAGPGFAAAARRVLLATRPAFFTASVLPVLVGTAWAGAVLHRFDGTLFALALAATVFAHAASNVYNDVGDDLIGADQDNVGRIYPYTGGSRFIQTGLLSRADMLRIAIGLAAAALLIGIALTALRGPGIVVLGLIGLGLGLLYSLPGVQLSARGVGESAVALGLGALPVLGAVWLQAGVIDRGALLVCVPVSAWVAAILLINEVPDADADARAGKRTLVVRFGRVGAQRVYYGLTAAALAASATALGYGDLPRGYALPAIVLAVLGMIAALGIAHRTANRERLKRSIEITLAIHTVGCLLLTAAIIARRYL